MIETELLQLLPWYTNNSLNKKDTLAVKSALEESEKMRLEFEALKILAKSLKEQKTNHKREKMAWQRLSIQINGLEKQKHQDKKIKLRRWLYAAAAAVVVGLQVNTLVIKHPDNTTVIPLSGPIESSEKDIFIQLELSPEMTLEELQQLLFRVNAQLAAGPSKLGIYHIRILEPTEYNINKIIETLQQHPGVLHAAEDNE